MKLPRISPEFTRSMMDGHGLIGVIFGAVIYVLCLSGALIVLVDELTQWERPEVPIVRHVSPAMLDSVSREVYARARPEGATHDIFISLPTPQLPQMNISAFGARGESGPHHEWSVDAAGHLGPAKEAQWVLFIQNLHFNLTVPGAIGRYIVGIFGTILLASLITGILAHRRILKDAFRLRWGGSKRLSNADLHNRIGVWALPFHLIVSLTGSLLGLSGLIIFILALVAYRGDQTRAVASLLGPQATEDARAQPFPDIRPMLAQIEAKTPGARISQVRYEHAGTAGQQVTIWVAAPGYLTTAENYVFTANGALKYKGGFTDGNVGMRIYGMITPLHYGTYGGVPLKIIYAILGAGLTMIVATGGNIWLARRRDQGRAAPKLERLWAGLLWGQPLALALAGIAEITGLMTSLPVYWLATLLTWVIALGSRDRAAVIRILRLAAGGALILLPSAKLAQGGGYQPTAIAVDIAFIVIGLTMIWVGASSMRRARSPLPTRASTGTDPVTAL